MFSDTSNKTGIIEDITFLTGMDTNNYPLVDRTRCVNRWYYKAVMAAFESSGDWEFDDTNQTGFPIATTTLVDDQADYGLPSNALRIQRVEVKDAGGIWHELLPVDDKMIPVALGEYFKTKGLPSRYRLIRNSIVLYAPPSTSMVTASAGLKIYFLREVDEFSASDTTQEPGIAEPFHRILSLGAAYDWVIAKGGDNAAALRQEVEILMNDLRKFYAGRHENLPPRIRTRVENYT